MSLDDPNQKSSRQPFVAPEKRKPAKNAGKQCHLFDGFHQTAGADLGHSAPSQMR
jgi:hypothetical protein